MARPISAGKRDMILNGNLIRAILTLAIPVMINSFIQSMYNLTDTFWLGKIGTANQAAILWSRHNDSGCYSYIAVPWCERRQTGELYG